MNALTIGLVGNPNCGKSTLFNALTGARQKVANWSGVTVECQTGQLVNHHNQDIQIVDLPGIYQLSQDQDDQAIDALITNDFILQQRAELIINVVDAVHLERHLYLTLQLLALNIPVIVVVNMLDVAQRRQLSINLPKLQQLLGCLVVGVVANKDIGLTELRKKLNGHHTLQVRQVAYPSILQEAILQVSTAITQDQPSLKFCATWLSQQLLQGVACSKQSLSNEIRTLAASQKIQVEAKLAEEIDIIIADRLYSEANQIVGALCTKANTTTSVTERIDKIVLNRYLGIPIFLAMMYLMFLFAINLGGAFQDFFDISSEAIFVQGMTQLLSLGHAPSWLIALLASGFGRGINTTISFIPVIAAMFFFLAILESSGYMARATFVVDRLMRAIGLPGKSFVPMIVGFGCNVPAILATRTLDSKRDRILTILMSPFMSCGARLAIFAVFTAAFFPKGGQNIVFILYLIGIIAAIFTGFILRQTLLKGEAIPLILELPAYHFPSFKMLMVQTWERLKSFIVNAGKLIIPVCMIIGLVNTITLDGKFTDANTHSQSILSSIGRVITPVLSPMGIKENNWPATVGLVTGVMAKEVVVATLNTLYAQEAHGLVTEQFAIGIPKQLQAALLSVPINLHMLQHSLTNPLAANSSQHLLDSHVYGIMYERFAGPVPAFAYLLFVLLYFPCISATAVMAKELNKKWALFSIFWSTGIAYTVATSFFQLATFRLHPRQSLVWVILNLSLFVVALSIMRRYGQVQNSAKPVAPAVILPDDLRHQL
jgi:ferrous iron transport protein B